MSQSAYKRVIMILADGARPDVLQEEMQKGKLPHLAKIAQNGTQQTMLTCFPSTTGPAYLPYLTGAFPGTCNIPGIRWFDKPTYAKKGWGFKSFRSYCGLESMLFDRDMNPDIVTAWDIFDKSKSIFNGVTKGLPKSKDLTAKDRIFLFYYAHLTDRWNFIDEAVYAKLKTVIDEKDFEFVFLVYPSVDEFSHRSSPFHPRVREAYHVIDELIGKTVADLQRNDLHEDTLIVLVSDHGLSETKEHFDVGPWLEEEKGIKTFYYSNIFKFKFDAVSMISGNGMANLYFKTQNGWGQRKSFEEISHESLLLDELRLREEVDLVVTQGVDGSIHLQTELGHGHYNFERSSGKFFYQFKNQDPLGIFKLGDEAIVNGFTADESLALTFDSHYPDVFMQMHQVFESPRTGDVIVTAKSGYDLRVKFEHPLHKASHGSICPEHMRVPLIMNHPIAAKHVRSVDVFPTVLSLLGKDVPGNIDGRVLK